MLNKLQQKFLYIYLVQSERFLLDKINLKEELLGCNLGKKDNWEKDSGTELAKISYLQGVWTYNETLLRTHFRWIRTIPCQSQRQSWCCQTSQVKKNSKDYELTCISSLFMSVSFLHILKICISVSRKWESSYFMKPHFTKENLQMINKLEKKSDQHHDCSWDAN